MRNQVNDEKKQTIFLSGSRDMGNFNEEKLIKGLQSLIDKEYHVVIGDADGADTWLQTFFHNKGYKNVFVYYSGNKIRNNVGKWQQRGVYVPRGTTGRAFYEAKDKAMANIADVGLVVWNGESIGSLNNVARFVEQGKYVVVYFTNYDKWLKVKDKEVLLKMARVNTRVLNICLRDGCPFLKNLILEAQND